jgi:hypothetical protein
LEALARTHQVDIPTEPPVGPTVVVAGVFACVVPTTARLLFETMTDGPDIAR